MTATSARAIYAGTLRRVAKGEHTFEGNVVIDVPANYSLFIDVDSINLPDSYALCRAGSAPLLPSP